MNAHSLSRREALKLTSAAAAMAASPAAAHATVSATKHGDTQQWECFEIVLRGPEEGNPFLGVTLYAAFRQGNREVLVDGFYDGAGTYKIRFMPDVQGQWSYRTASNAKVLDGHEGAFTCTAPANSNHGPVRVANEHHFAYADGKPYFPFGTTCYAWVHQSEALQRQTLATLKGAPFNKIRMCVFPKHYEYNHNEPPLYPFPHTGSSPADAAWENDFSRFNPAFFAHIEHRIAELRALNIEADLILFHPYDNWGYQAMPAEVDDRYVRYVLARMSAYRNIWWSLANEYDLMKSKTTADFDRIFLLVQTYDPYAHLRSIHFSRVMYDYSRPWVTHASIQNAAFEKGPQYIADWRKPGIFDEVQYEGNLNKRWGNICGEELTRRFWLGVMAGCYVTHGETLLDADAPMTEDATPTLWWSHGGTLKGTSPAGIAFLRRLVEESAEPHDQVHAGFEAQSNPYYLNATVYDADRKRARTVLYYFAEHQPLWYEFPLPEGTFAVDAVDPEARTVTSLPGQHSGKTRLRLSGKPYQALRFRRTA